MNTPTKLSLTANTTPTPGPSKLDLRTIQTTPGTSVEIFRGEREWAEVTLLLKSAGPVSVGVDKAITLDKGDSVSLTQDVPLKLTVARGQTLFVFSGAVSQLQIIVEPIAWGEQLLAALQARGV